MPITTDSSLAARLVGAGPAGIVAVGVGEEEAPAAVAVLLGSGVRVGGAGVTVGDTRAVAVQEAVTVGEGDGTRVAMGVRVGNGGSVGSGAAVGYGA